MSNRDDSVLAYSIIVLLVFLLLAMRGLFANQGVAVRALDAQGFTGIHIVDHSWFLVGLRGCDGKDAARFTARATNASGKSVEVYVCTGVLFKGGTIRVP